MREGALRRPDSVAAYDLPLMLEGLRRTPRVRPRRDGSVQVTLDGVAHELRLLASGERQLRYAWDGVARRAVAVWQGGVLHLAREAHVFVFDEPSPVPQSDRHADAGRALAPVAGVVAKLAVQPGDSVAAGQPLVCVEAMKMEMWVAAGAAGRVVRVVVQAGQQVASGALLVELELAAAAAE